MIPKYGLYTYGIVGKDLEQLNILGIDKKNKVYPVSGNDLAVLVSKIDTGKFKKQVKDGLSELTKAERILRAHEDVVDAIAKLTTIIPFKFGTILKNEKVALQMLKNNKEKFKRLVSKFTEREEWGIKVYADSKKFREYLIYNQPTLKQQIKKQGELPKGVAYLLGKKIEEEVNNEVTRYFSETAKVIFQEMEKFAFEAQINKILPQKITGADKEMLLNSAYLIEKEKVANFNKHVKRLIEKYETLGLDFKVSGPWPPYSFT